MVLENQTGSESMKNWLKQPHWLSTKFVANWNKFGGKNPKLFLHFPVCTQLNIALVGLLTYDSSLLILNQKNKHKTVEVRFTEGKDDFR